MKIESYKYPKSSFLSVDKDMEIIIDKICSDERLKKLLYYTSRDALDRPELTDEQTDSMFGKQIKIIPKITVDQENLVYMVVTFDNFMTNVSNPEFRDNVIEFDIVCHFDQWNLKDYQLRPYKIAAELDTLFNDKRLTGIGKLQFLGAKQILLTDEFAGLCVMYEAIHGEEDKKKAINPKDDKDVIINFDKIYNE